MKRNLVVALILALGVAGCAGSDGKPGVEVSVADQGLGELIPPEASTSSTAAADTSTTTGPPVTTATAARPTTSSAPKVAPTTRPKPTTTSGPATTTTSGVVDVTTTTLATTTSTAPRPASVVDVAMRADGKGGWLVRRDGSVIVLGNAPALGSAAGRLWTATDIVATPSGNGYWITGEGGEVFAFGDADFHGDMSKVKLHKPVQGLVPDREDGVGYMLMSEDGGIYAFESRFKGSAGATKQEPMVSFSADPSGTGYWMTTSDGVVFNFGLATHFGDLNQVSAPPRILAMAPTGTGRGYYMLSHDGGVFAFGDAKFHGSLGAQQLPQPVVTIEASPTGSGYWLICGDGAVHAFGDAPPLSVRS